MVKTRQRVISAREALILFKLAALSGVPGQSIAALVLRVTGMAFDPMPFDVMSCYLLVQSLPQIDVFNRLLIGRAPAILPPVVDPLIDTVFNILTVSGEIHPTALIQRCQRFHGSEQFHTIIGGVAKPFTQFFAMLVEDQYRTITAGTGIAETGAVGINFQMFHRISQCLCAGRQYNGGR